MVGGQPRPWKIQGSFMLDAWVWEDEYVWIIFLSNPVTL